MRQTVAVYGAVMRNGKADATAIEVIFSHGKGDKEVLMLSQGGTDFLVPFEPVEKLIKAVRKNGKKHTEK